MGEVLAERTLAIIRYHKNGQCKVEVQVACKVTNMFLISRYEMRIDWVCCIPWM